MKNRYGLVSNSSSSSFIVGKVADSSFFNFKLMEPYLFTVYLLCVMVISGIIKEKNLFIPLYNSVLEKIKSKKLIVFLVSCIGGVLPIPGRVVVSAGILDIVVDKTKTKQRSKFGLVDFLSTHHYYWWSPLEKTVIIPMAALGLTYLQFMKYAWLPLLISLLFAFYYIFVVLKEDDVHINKLDQPNTKSIWLSVLPIMISVAVMCFGVAPYYIFPITLFYYMLYCKEFNLKKLNNYINWKLILLTSGIIFVSEMVALKNSQLIEILKTLTETLNIHSIIGFVVISIISFTITFILGSSSKYAGIVSILTSLFGLKYLTYFLCLEFFAYLLSPTHKCVLISSTYFNTPLKDYYKVLSIWGLTLLIFGLATILL